MSNRQRGVVSKGTETMTNTGRTTVDTRLFDLYERMIGEVEVPGILRQVADVVRDTFRAERATVFLVRTATHELESVAVIGNVARSIRIPIQPDSLAGYSAVTREVFAVEDAYGDLSHVSPTLRFDRSWDRVNRFRTREVMCAPACFRDDVLGVIEVINAIDRPFDREAVAELGSISRLVGYALYHARNYDELTSLRRLKKQKAQFMRVMVHELKSPIASARMLTSGLTYAHKDDERLQTALGKVGRRLDELLGMVEDVLHLSKVHEGGALGEVKVLDLGEEVRRICEPYAEQAAAKGLGFELAVPPDSPRIRFDEKGFALVVSNLVSNAVKYTSQGTVTVSVGQDDGATVLRVKDTGIGIPEADLPRMFQEFFRAGNARRRKIKGTGVGLAGVKDLVERFGGNIEIWSKENEGTEFTVRLAPADETAPPS